MTTWTDQTKNPNTNTTSGGMPMGLLLSLTYATGASESIWSDQTKNTTSFSDQNKNVTTFSNQTKN